MYDYIAHWQAQQAEAVCQKLLWSHQVNCLCLCVMPFILPACSVRTHSCVIKREGKTEPDCVGCSMFGLFHHTRMTAASRNVDEQEEERGPSPQPVWCPPTVQRHAREVRCRLQILIVEPEQHKACSRILNCLEERSDAESQEHNKNVIYVFIMDWGEQWR